MMSPIDQSWQEEGPFVLRGRLHFLSSLKVFLCIGNSKKLCHKPSESASCWLMTPCKKAFHPLTSHAEKPLFLVLPPAFWALESPSHHHQLMGDLRVYRIQLIPEKPKKLHICLGYMGSNGEGEWSKVMGWKGTSFKSGNSFHWLASSLHYGFIQSLNQSYNEWPQNSSPKHPYMFFLHRKHISSPLCWWSLKCALCL